MATLVRRARAFLYIVWLVLYSIATGRYAYVHELERHPSINGMSTSSIHYKFFSWIRFYHTSITLITTIFGWHPPTELVEAVEHKITFDTRLCHLPWKTSVFVKTADGVFGGTLV